MRKLTITDVIHTPSKTEFERIVKLYAMDDEFLSWDIYEKNTVLYVLNNQYGDINGYCKDHNFKVIKSIEL